MKASKTAAYRTDAPKTTRASLHVRFVVTAGYREEGKKVNNHWFKREFSSLNEANYVYEKLRKTKGVAWVNLSSSEGDLKCYPEDLDAWIRYG